MKVNEIFRLELKLGRRKYLFLFIFVINILFASPQVENIFNNANDLYKAGDYNAAIEKYENILSRGYESAELYYNLGNTYYKEGEIGEAILNYERAKKLSPNNDNINFNLSLASQKVEGNINSPESFILFEFIQNLIDAFSAKGWAVIFTVTFLMFSIFFATLQLSPSEKLYGLLRKLIVMFLILVILTIYPISKSLSKENSETKGIVLKEQSTALAAPQDGSTELFNVNEGVKVQILDRQNNWLEIKLLNGNQGWIKSAQIGII